jgi:xanthine/CO dehydrogenase XdhC/CoxF family maturation factor
MRDVVDAWRRSEARGEPAVLATVVRVQGSGYRRSGARLLLAANGQSVGTISGGCIESDIARRGWWLTASGSTIVSYDASMVDDGGDDPGSGCGGVISVLLERLTPHGDPHPLHVIEAVHRARRSGVVVTALDDHPAVGPVGAHCLVFPDGVVWSSARGDVTALRTIAEHAIASGVRDGVCTTTVAGVPALVEIVPPPPSLVVFGTGADAQALVMFAKALGWDVTVTGSHAVRARPERFPQADRVVLTSPDDPLAGVPLDAQSAAGVMTHSLTLDRAVLHALRRVPLRYLGLLGPRHRADRVLTELFDGDPAGLLHMRARLHSPIGLDIGAEGPGEIALAMVAEIRAVLASRAGGHLRERSAPLHGAQTLLLPPSLGSHVTALRRSVMGGRR